MRINPEFDDSVVKTLKRAEETASSFEGCVVLMLDNSGDNYSLRLLASGLRASECVALLEVAKASLVDAILSNTKGQPRGY